MNKSGVFQMVRDRLAFALDVPSDREAIDEKLVPVAGMTKWVKINSVFFGPDRDYALGVIREAGSVPFVDIKGHDIPTSTARNAYEAWRMGAGMITIHASGTSAMMREVMKAFSYEQDPPIILAITVLTSISDEMLNHELKVNGNTAGHVVHLARLARDAGVHGVVCSPNETRFVRQACGEDFIIVNPGIRFSGEKERDQERANTPKNAILNGADALVMGSDLLKDPANNVPRALNEIEAGLVERG